MDGPITVSDLAEVLPHTEVETYLAIAGVQGGRQTLTFNLSLRDAARLLPIPDPARPTPGNRRVNEKHAREFGEYLRAKPAWVAPPILLRDAGTLKFDKISDLAGGLTLGYLRVPANASETLKIIDGQHRIFGLSWILKELRREIDRATEQRAAAEYRGDMSAASTADAELSNLTEILDRLTGESLTVVVYEERFPQQYEQMFFDVADNALGIKQAIRVQFDSTKIVNRSLDRVLENSLLTNRVDLENDRVVGSNTNLVGAKHVADIIRAVNVGVVGRIGKQRENEFTEDQLVSNTDAFLDSLTAGFEDLGAVADGRLSPADLRKRSLLGSVTMLRVLAGVYHNISARTGGEAGLTDAQITDFFRRLSPHMKAPITARSIWNRQAATKEHFDVGTFGPQARSQNLKGLTAALTSWALIGLPGE